MAEKTTMLLAYVDCQRATFAWTCRSLDRAPHLFEEYARHNGHADLLREVVDGETGEWPDVVWQACRMERRRGTGADRR